jgi:predicted flavoprotein YhiN
MIKSNNLSGCEKCDIAIIGAGPAGIMAAISAASAASAPNISICLLERNESAAKKLLLTGNGRCNYTADIERDEMLSAFGKKGRFFSEAFSMFSNRDLIAFFKAEGIEPEFEKSDENEAIIKVFPKNKNASSVRQCLVEKLKGKSIHVIYGFRAEKVLKIKNPEKTGEKYFFEIQPYSGRGFDNHLNHNIRNNLEPDNTGTGNPLLSNPAAGISGSGKYSIANYILDREPLRVFARKVVLATGGRTYPQTGSTGDGYIIAKNLGHSISELSPYLVPVFSKDRDIALLAGVSVKEACLKILSGKKVMAKSTGSILFTHKGLSGPCAVSLGHEVYKLLHNKYKKGLAGHSSDPFDEPGTNQGEDKMPAAAYYKDCDRDLLQNFDKGLKQGYGRGPEQDFFIASIDLAPNLSFEDFKKEIFTLYKSNPKKELLTILNMVLANVPERLLDLILIRSNVIKNLKIGNLSKTELTGIYNTIKNLEFKIDSDLHFDEAIVTDGGIPVKEINPRDVQSVLTRGLYFAGEIIELAGPEGGFNLQKAFSTGWLAGKSAAESLNLEIF